MARGKRFPRATPFSSRRERQAIALASAHRLSLLPLRLLPAVARHAVLPPLSLADGSWRGRSVQQEPFDAWSRHRLPLPRSWLPPRARRGADRRQARSRAGFAGGPVGRDSRLPAPPIGRDLRNARERIDRARESGALSRREARQLKQEARLSPASPAVTARDGLSASEKRESWKRALCTCETPSTAAPPMAARAKDKLTAQRSWLSLLPRRLMPTPT